MTRLYDEWAFVATPGRLFDVIINPRPGRCDGRVRMVCYGNSAGYLPEAGGGAGLGAPEAQGRLTQEWLNEFLEVAPGLRGRVVAAHLQTWRHCFSLIPPERAAALDQLRQPLSGTLHFAGDYTSETAGTHGAFTEAARVAATIAATT